MESKYYPSMRELSIMFTYYKGNLYWKSNKGGVNIGDIAGHADKGTGHHSVEINGKLYLTSRLTYILHFVNMGDNFVIDHIDGNKLNNDIDNLRKIII